MKTIARVARCNNKKNQTGSILIILAIFLSTVLLTVICSFADWMIRSKKENAAIDYGSQYGTFISMDSNQLREIQRHGEFSEIGLTADAGFIRLDKSVSFMTMDETARRFAQLDLYFVDGTFPEAVNEIAAQKEFFEAAGYEQVQVGDIIQLQYRSDLKHKYEPMEFSVSGILHSTANEEAQKRFLVFTSQAFFENQYEIEARKYSVGFRLGEEVRITTDNAEEVIGALAKECGIPKERVSVNMIYLMLVLEAGVETLSVCAVIIAAVILFSVIIIYNIFQVGIVQNIREYGKIRALGAGKKQMRRLILQEGLSLAGCGIPLGIAVGYIVSWGCILWLTEQEKMIGSIEHIRISVFSAPALLLAAGFALLTVLIALRKPMKIVASVSPVEAIRYIESTGSSKAGYRKGRRSMSVWALTAANIAANKKRTVVTILTMGLSCVLFVILANCIGNMDSEYAARGEVECGQFQIELEYYLEDEAYPENNLDFILKHNPLNDRLIERIKGIDGVTEVKTRNILLANCGGRKEDIAVLDEESFTRLKERSGMLIGDLDYQTGAEQNCFYYGWAYFFEKNGFQQDQPFSAEITDGTRQVTVDGQLAGSFGYAPASYIITEEMYRKMGLTGATTGWLWVDCRPEDAAEVGMELKQLLAETEHVEITEYERQLELAASAVKITKIGCYLFLVILGLIGFMNLANTMIMNIITKKQEYGILQAVGMTNRQLNASLQLQGMLFSAGTVLVAILTGLPIGYAVFCYGKENAVFGLNVYHIPVWEIAGMVIAIGLLQALLSFLLSRNLKKESLVERIRYQE